MCECECVCAGECVCECVCVSVCVSVRARVSVCVNASPFGGCPHQSPGGCPEVAVLMKSVHACLSADAGHWSEGLFPAPLAKRQTKLVTLSVIIANPPHLDQSPSTRPAPAWGGKTAAPTRLPPALDLLSRWFACLRQSRWPTRGPNWVQTGEKPRSRQGGDGAGTGAGGRPEEPLAYRRGAWRPRLVLDAHKSPPSHMVHPRSAPRAEGWPRMAAESVLGGRVLRSHSDPAEPELDSGRWRHVPTRASPRLLSSKRVAGRHYPREWSGDAQAPSGSRGCRDGSWRCPVDRAVRPLSLANREISDLTPCFVLGRPCPDLENGVSSAVQMPASPGIPAQAVGRRPSPAPRFMAPAGPQRRRQSPSP